jgi:hypothetical protein
MRSPHMPLTGARSRASTPATPSSPLRATTRCRARAWISVPHLRRAAIQTPLDANDPNDQRRYSTSDARSLARPTTVLDADLTPPTRRRGCRSGNCDVGVDGQRRDSGLLRCEVPLGSSSDQRASLSSTTSWSSQIPLFPSLWIKSSLVPSSSCAD